MNNWNNSSNSGSDTAIERDKIEHDEVAQQLQKLAKISDNYYESYLKLSKAKEDYKKAELEVNNLHQMLLTCKTGIRTFNAKT